jgi:hypothetical protein
VIPVGNDNLLTTFDPFQVAAELTLDGRNIGLNHMTMLVLLLKLSTAAVKFPSVRLSAEN